MNISGILSQQLEGKNATEHPAYQFLGYGNLSKTHHCEHKELDAFSSECFSRKL